MREQVTPTIAELGKVEDFKWYGDVQSLHAQWCNASNRPQRVLFRGVRSEGERLPWRFIELEPRERYRMLLSKTSESEVGVEVVVPEGVESLLHDVFDRAHFPTAKSSEGTLNQDVSPLPAYQGPLVSPISARARVSGV